MDPSLYKDVKRRQVAHLRPQGYGLLVPDIIGAGGTDKPADADAFRLAQIARDVADVLDAAEGLSKVVGIGHDWGFAVLSRLANLYEDRFSAFAWVAVSYWPPAREPLDIDALIARMRAETGNEHFGYWKFFSRSDAHLYYPHDWLEWLISVGKTEEWLTASPEYNITRERLLNAGLKSTCNYYTAQVENKNLEDDKKIPERSPVTTKPALFIATAKDAVCTPALGKSLMKAHVPHAKIVDLNAGHWPQLETTERFNQEIDAWIQSLSL
ncbi:alpha/beta-hydrolase [Trametes meyenii]|nr:alpha/beta-hydrolase [Trametes meyenii]